MKNLQRLLLLFILGTLVSCQTTKYKTVESTDSNGYKYQTVTNDPFKARIYTLNNGLTVYLSRNTDQPRISTLIGVKAGSAYEDPNATGLAHYLEHMMFKGTSKIGAVNWEEEKVLLDKISDLFEQYRGTGEPAQKKLIYARIDSISQIAASYVATNEVDKMYKSIGDNMLNAGTSYESTVYMSEVPKNEIENWARIEKERFSDVVLRLFHTELETVYEEFNMYQDMDNARAEAALYKELFPVHPYGRDVIGLPEQLKNPSMVEIRKFINNYYVPNNMAISLAGDFEFEPVIAMIDKYFGGMKQKEVIKPLRPAEEPITSVRTKEIFGPQQDFINVAFRFKGANSEDELYVTLISKILSNGQAGLFDLNLNQGQKVQNASSSVDFLKDYGINIFTGRPKQGQTLEEVQSLMLEQLEKIKKGEFDEWLLQAIINEQKLSFMRALERSFPRAYYMINGFINETPHSEVVSFIDKLGKITKVKLVAFANENYKDNYAVLYKRFGPNTDMVKVEKPQITPVKINRDQESQFAKELLSGKVPPIEPVFVDYDGALKREDIKPGVKLFYAPNEINGIFDLSFVVEVGKNHNINLPAAFEYLSMLGTDKFSPEELKKELYRYGLTLNMTSGPRSCNIRISGLDEYLDKGMEFLEQVISNAKPDSGIFEKYVNRVIKSRSDARKNPNSIRFAMEDYGIFGEDSPTRYFIPENKLRAIAPEELTKLAGSIFSYPHMISYYGPSPAEKVKEAINKYHKVPQVMLPVPEIRPFNYVMNQKPVVYVLDYDISQANISILFNDIKFMPEIYPYAQIFNNFYDPIVFQEIREAKGLAYTATASYRTPSFSDQMTRFSAFMSTQADKLKTATESMEALMKNMPGDENYFTRANDGLISNISTQRITNRMLFSSWWNNKNMGFNNDPRKLTFETAKSIKLDTIKEFFNKHITVNKPTYVILGNVKMLDMKALAKIGELKLLKLEDVFGY